MIINQQGEGLDSALPAEDSAVLVFLSLPLMSCRSAKGSLSSGFSSLDTGEGRGGGSRVSHRLTLQTWVPTAGVGGRLLDLPPGLRASLRSGRSRVARLGLRLRWLCLALSSYSSGRALCWDGPVG